MLNFLFHLIFYVYDLLLGVIFVCLTVCPTLGPCCIEACGPGVSVQVAPHDGHKILYFTNGRPRIKRLISMYNQSSLSWFCRLMNQSRPVCQPRMDPCKTRDPLHPTPNHHSFLISISLSLFSSISFSSVENLRPAALNTSQPAFLSLSSFSLFSSFLYFSHFLQSLFVLCFLFLFLLFSFNERLNGTKGGPRSVQTNHLLQSFWNSEWSILNLAARS